MARTTIAINMNGKSVDNILSIIEKEMSVNKYSRKIVKGEDVWSKGDGVIMKRECFAVVFTDNSVVLQAWLQDAITGESDLNGISAIVIKKKMKKIIENIAQAI